MDLFSHHSCIRSDSVPQAKYNLTNVKSKRFILFAAKT